MRRPSRTRSASLGRSQSAASGRSSRSTRMLASAVPRAGTNGQGSTPCSMPVAGRFDVVMAWAIDRVGRSLIDLLLTIQDLETVGVDLYLDQQHLDTTTPTGKLLFHATGGTRRSRIPRAVLSNGGARTHGDSETHSGFRLLRAA